MKFGVDKKIEQEFLAAALHSKAKRRHSSRVSQEWWKSWNTPLICSGLTLFGSGSVVYPSVMLLPVSAILLWLIRYDIKFFQSFPKKRWLLSAFVVALALGATVGAITYTAQPADAAFSFLFADTEKALKTCVLQSVTAATALAGIMFGGLRVAFMVGIGVAGYNIWTQRQQGQDYHDTLQIVLTAILVIVIIGAIEPLIVGTSGCGGA